MFEKNNSIIKIDALDHFVSIVEAFGIGLQNEIDGKGYHNPQIRFEFRVYDPNQPKGGRTKEKIDFYMGIEEATYFAQIMKSGSIASMVEQQKARQLQHNAKYPEPAYIDRGGSEKGGSIIARQLSIQHGDRIPFLLKAEQGPGMKNQKGGYCIDYKQNNLVKRINIGLTLKQCIQIGSAIERAINIYDSWVSYGLVGVKLLNKLKSIEYQKDASQEATSAQREARPQPVINEQPRRNQQAPQQPPQQYGWGQQPYVAAQAQRQPAYASRPAQQPSYVAKSPQNSYAAQQEQINFSNYY